MFDKKKRLFKINKPQQIAIVVYDLQKSMEKMWNMFGIGPWKVYVRDYNSTQENSVISEMFYLGKPGKFTYQTASIGAIPSSGIPMPTGAVFELVQPLSGENIYSDFLNEHGEGIQHIGWHETHNYDKYIKTCNLLEQNGIRCLQSQKMFTSCVSYFDTNKVLGTILEVNYQDPKIRRPEPLYYYPTI